MTDNLKPLITFCIPVLNESDNLDRLLARLGAFAQKMSDTYRFEFLFTDNCSTDDTFERLQAIANADERIRVLRFSRNFGFQRSILTNYLNARGDALIQIDADLQDPPELAEEFLSRWREGYKVVYGIRRKRREPSLVRIFRKIGYRTINLLSEYPIPPDAGDFRLIDRSVIDVLAKFNDQRPYLRGMIAGMGFRQIGIPYDRDQRDAGESKFNFLNLAGLGLDGIFSTSMIPLRIASWVGVGAIGITALGILYYFVLYFSGVTFQLGMVSLHILILASVGINALLLSVFGSYLGRIYINTRGGPITVIENSIDSTRADSTDRS